jgi:hypothetical protein
MCLTEHFKKKPPKDNKVHKVPPNKGPIIATIITVNDVDINVGRDGGG